MLCNKQPRTSEHLDGRRKTPLQLFLTIILLIASGVGLHLNWVSENNSV